MVYIHVPTELNKKIINIVKLKYHLFDESQIKEIVFDLQNRLFCNFLKLITLTTTVKEIRDDLDYTNLDQNEINDLIKSFNMEFIPKFPSILNKDIKILDCKTKRILNNVEETEYIIILEPL